MNLKFKRWLEIQTSGTKLDDEYLRFLRDNVGISTISLSLSSLNSIENAKYNRTKKGFEVDIQKVCSEIKKYDFNLRLSLNLTDWFDSCDPEFIFNASSDLGADQVTLRVLYLSGNRRTPIQTPEDNWIMKHKMRSEDVYILKDYVRYYCRPLEKLPFGAIKYSIKGMSVVIDADCMSTDVTDTMKYLILRPNAKLYSKWDDKGSLVF
jgi:sulfatase maturation enzyme AslB (radical SAM superfamily)